MAVNMPVLKCTRMSLCMPFHMPERRYAMGNIELSDAEWARLRQYTATADELAQTPSSWDERAVRKCKGHAIQDQKQCGPCSVFRNVSNIL